jgi:putative restriction endonuclease
MEVELDRRIRLAVFEHLRLLAELHGDVLPYQALRPGLRFEDRVVHLMGPQGIFTPAGMDAPISITTSPSGPYDDQPTEDGFLHYRYRGTDPMHTDNVRLRRAYEGALPLVYFRGVVEGRYQAAWPVLVVGDDPGWLTFTVAPYEPEVLRPDLSISATDAVHQAYVRRHVWQRVHQAAFRTRVLTAYDTTCAVCRLQRHSELLDAAHIRPDRPNLDSPPVVPNGLALCKIHHAAFDRNILGVRPDHVIEIRADILEEVDGPMLEHGLQGHHGEALLLPRRQPDRPNPEFLEERYEAFRAAS